MTRRVPKLTLREFTAWLAGSKADIAVIGPYVIRPCRCGDVNCKGWRLTSPGAAA